MDSHGTYHCNDCNEGYDGYHYCDWGRDKVAFECIDCGEQVTRNAKDGIDIEGVAPKRCVTCTLDRMAEP